MAVTHIHAISEEALAHVGGISWKFIAQESFKDVDSLAEITATHGFHCFVLAI